MIIYTHRCRICGKKYVSTRSVGYKCADCISQSQALQRVSFPRDSFRHRDGFQREIGISSGVIPRGSGALAAAFFKQPRGSKVKVREVTYKNGEFIFREEYR